MKKQLMTFKDDKTNKNVTRLFDASKMTDAALLNELNLTKFGDTKTRRARISKFGINTIAKKRFPFFRALLNEVYKPFNMLILFLIALDLFTYFLYEPHFDHIISAIVSVIILVITYTITLLQEYISYKIEVKMNDVITNRFNILKTEIEALEQIKFEELMNQLDTVMFGKITVGDVIFLKPGDVVPADMRIIWSSNFAIDDNLIRGRMVRVKKSANYTPAEYLYDLENIVICHTTVTDGYALGVVVNIAKNKVSQSYIERVESQSKPFYFRGLNKIIYAIMFSALVIFPITMLSVYFSSNTKGLDMWITAILYAITIVVALIPESLPALIAFNLQHGNKKIKNKNMIVKNFQAIQDLGAIDTFISNKTGPITRDRPILVNWYNYKKEKDDKVFHLAYLNAYFQNSMHFHFEQAILDFVDDNTSIIDGYKYIRTKKANDSKKIGSVVVKKDDVEYQITVASYVQIIDDLHYYNQDGEVHELTEENKFELLHNITDYTTRGFRALVVASKIITDNENLDNADLMYEGIVVFQELVRDDIQQALGMFKKYNIDFRILSGDNIDILKWTANTIGMEKITTLTGKELEAMTQDELQVIIKGINLFANLTPIQKSAVLYNFIKTKHVVGYLGDGISDVLAIKRADVGIVPNTATPVAKNFADIVVLEKDLNNFNGAFKWGRITFLNTLKYIKLSISTNLGLFLAVFIAGIWMPFLPLTSTQLLIQNLIIDFANIAFITDRVSADSISKPIRWNTKSFISFTLITCLVPAIMSLVNLVIICYGLGWYNDGLTNEDMMARQIQTTFFIESFITRITTIFIYRTEHISIFSKYHPRWKFTLIMLSMLAGLILLAYIPGLNNKLEMVPPVPVWWPIMIANVGILWCLEEATKHLYQKIFKMWF